MGWPGCMRCNNWPSLGHSGLCNVCIKNPALVEEVANQMFDSSFAAHKKDLDRSILLSFLEREPNGELVKLVYDKIQEKPQLKVSEAIEEVRKDYWKYFPCKNEAESIIKKLIE